MGFINKIGGTPKANIKSVSGLEAGATSPVPEILWWKFPNGSGSTATAAVGPDCALGAAPPTWAAGYGTIPYSLDFDGSDDRAASASAVTYGSPEITIAMWLRWDAFSNNDDLALESSNNSNNNAYTFVLDPNSSSPAAFVVAVKGATGTLAKSFTRPTQGFWHHYAFAMSQSANTGAGDLVIYVDGSAVSMNTDTNNKTGTSNFSTQTLYLMHRGTLSLFGDGAVDDLRIYSKLLSSTEVAQVYANPQ
jgi:uncharacterized protein